MKAEEQFICECGWKMQNVPIADVNKRGGRTIADMVRPPKFQLVCRNHWCEHYGERYEAPVRRLIMLKRIPEEVTCDIR